MKKRILALCLSLCMCLSLSAVAFAEPYVEDNTMPYLYDTYGGQMRGASMPTESWDLSNGSYEGRIASVGVSNGVYTNYYFNCNSAGKLKVTGTISAKYGGYTGSRCIIRIYNAVTKALVTSYDAGYDDYSSKYISHTFTGLKSGTAYAVMFYNGSKSEFSNPLSGPITVSWP